MINENKNVDVTRIKKTDILNPDAAAATAAEVQIHGK